MILKDPAIIFTSYYLKGDNGILENIGKRDDVFVCLYESEDVRKYVAFKNVLDFIVFYHKVLDKEKAFHEVIIGSNNQKIRFDIDYLVEENDTSYDLLEMVLDEVIRQFGIIFKIKINVERDICLYSSHGLSSGKLKKSYHIVVNNYCLQNNKLVDLFYNIIIQNIPEDCRKYIDDGIYKSKQNFRIVFSRKKDNERYKTPMLIWKFHGKEIFHEPGNGESPISSDHLFFLIVNESLVTSCSGLKILELQQESFKKSLDTTFETLPPEQISDLLGKITKRYYNNDFPYKYTNLSNEYLIFTRIKPSFCPICQRDHDSENAFAVIINSTMFFYCRRNKKKIAISTIEMPTVKPNVPKESEISRQLFRQRTKFKSGSIFENSIFKEESERIALQLAQPKR